MARGFGHTKRRIEQAKRQKREEKRLRKLNKNAAPIEQPVQAFPSEEAGPEEVLPAETT